MQGKTYSNAILTRHQTMWLGFCHCPINFCAHSHTYLLSLPHTPARTRTPRTYWCTNIDRRMTRACDSNGYYMSQPSVDVNQRFRDPKFGVSEFINDIQDSNRLCAQQDGVLPAGTVKYYACTQGGVLSIDRSRLFMVGRYVQLTLHSPISTNLHVREMEVHGY